MKSSLSCCPGFGHWFGKEVNQFTEWEIDYECLRQEKVPHEPNIVNGMFRIKREYTTGIMVYFLYLNM